MTERLLRACVLVCALLPASAQAQTHPCDTPQATTPVAIATGESVRVGFCSNVADLTSYTLFVNGEANAPGVPVKVSADPNSGGLWYYETPALLTLPATATALTLQVTNLDGFSPLSEPLLVAVGTVEPPPPPPPPQPPCADIPSVFITRWEMTTGKPGSRMRLNYQLASLSPVTSLVAAINDGVVATVTGTDLTATGGIWFLTPAIGVYKLTLTAVNAAGCSKRVYSLIDLQVK